MHIRKIRTKLLLPVFVVLALTSALGVWALNGGVSALVLDQLTTTNEILNRGLEESTAAKMQAINGNIQRMSNRALEEAVILANMPGVADAYRLAHEGDLDDENDPFLSRRVNSYDRHLSLLLPHLSRQWVLMS